MFSVVKFEKDGPASAMGSYVRKEDADELAYNLACRYKKTFAFRVFTTDEATVIVTLVKEGLMTVNPSVFDKS